jgi:SAM-dependent methyltransferase
VKKQESNLKSYSEVVRCGGCRSISLETIFDFGQVPLAGYFPKVDDSLIPLLPMQLLQCKACELYQISPDLYDSDLFSDYRYVSSIGMQSHFDELASWFVSTQNAALDSKIIEFGCNDGPLLSALSAHGFSPIGIDPATNIVDIAKAKGLRVINDFFGKEALSKYEEIQGVDFIFSSNSFAHISDIYSIAETISQSLNAGGRFIVEVQSFVSILEKNAFDFIYHEHKYYYTLKSISGLLEQFGLNLLEYWAISTHGGSYRLVFGKNTSNSNSKAYDAVARETEYLKGKKIVDCISKYRFELGKVDEYLKIESESGKRVIAFGASGRGNMLLANLPSTRSILPGVIDQSPERVGRLMAQNGVPVMSFDLINTLDYEVVLVLAWNYLDAIISKWGVADCEFVVPLPEFKVISGRSHKEIRS